MQDLSYLKYNYFPTTTGAGTGAGTGTGTGVTVIPSVNGPAIGVPTINRLQLHQLNGAELRKKVEYIREHGDFPGSDNPQMWRDLAELDSAEPSLPKPYVTPSCITVPGSSCDVPDDNNFIDRDVAEKYKKLIEEQNRQNEQKEQDKNQGDSCGPGDRPDFLDPINSNENTSPEASSQNNDGDGQSEGDNNTEETIDAGEPEVDLPPIENLDPSSLISRQTPAEMSKNRVNKLRKKMRKDGFDPNHPVEVYDVDGKYIIKDGHHRVEAAIRERIRKIPVRKYNVSSEQEKNQYLMEAAEAAGFRGDQF